MKVEPFAYKDFPANATANKNIAPAAIATPSVKSSKNEKPYAGFFDPRGGKDLPPSEEAIAREKAAHDTGYQKGLEEGKGQKLEIESALNSLLGQLVARWDELKTLAENHFRHNESATILLAKTIAESILNRELSTSQVEMIAATVKEYLPRLCSESFIVVYVHPELKDAVSEKLTSLKLDFTYTGNLNADADPNLALGDCRIAWKDGGIIDEKQALLKAVVEKIESFMTSKT